MQRHVATRMLGIDGGRVVIDVAALCVVGVVLLVLCAWSQFGEIGLNVGLLLSGLTLFWLASVRAKRVRSGST